MPEIAPLDMNKISRLIDLAIEEDYGQGDPTSELTVEPGVKSHTRLVAREPLVVCGMDVVREVLKRYDESLELIVVSQDAASISRGDVIAEIYGPLRQMLSAERVALNFLQRLSGVATKTAQYVKEVQGTKAKILDTRKTTPGWRELEKYAVRCGGGMNHRYNLGDGVMLKDNHFAHMGAKHKDELEEFAKKAHQHGGLKFVCIEVDDIETQLPIVLSAAGVDIILLDNMTCPQLRQAVKMRDENPGHKPLLEASGGITLATLRDVAETGVDRISIGAVTHSAVSIDIGLDK
ncbi:putative nicotinate-nucleotide pyrophosphorylase, carboxylating [Limihaloglobus sulfuriphilus]|uniref:Probable nicotinate-nucleotide pyrophosphorylase [carboxylating] n=1 Tax=Limihaloglobus sulfuriphilus TaxID=1851148 RepID=A0A1Q2MGY9_9BACT|nr:carboxylating nicotinate-nucleotide diphosphorylase [Limihaloglobus sulfuriphilus]AQQ71532.1 putative nicotinate-nucleotide pyrophosphorylase, carboxylating [Limihaloglobus sulfuriphilus]